MAYSDFTRRVVRPALTFFLAAGVSVGCLNSALLDINDPDVLNAGGFKTAAGADPLRYGVIQDFQNVFASGVSSIVMVSGNFADEMYSTDTFDDRLFVNARATTDNLPGMDGFYLNMHRARTGAETAIDVLKEVVPGQTANIAELQGLLGYTQIFFGELYCSGVPFSRQTDAGTEYGAPLSTTQIFDLAIASFDAALAGAGSNNQVKNLAAVGKARALLNQGQFAAAAAAVAAVPTSFKYNASYSAAGGASSNGVWSSLLDGTTRYGVVNNEGGSPMNWMQTPADPRIPWQSSTRTGFNGTSINLPDILKFGDVTSARGAPITVAGGIEARLIEAEAGLQAGTQAARDAMFAALNTLRATGIEPAMAPIAGSAPTTQAAAVDLLFRERAFWMYLEGHRMGDLRRLVRQYGRTPDSVFPTGNFPSPLAGTYGTDVNFPIPFDEIANPLFTGCIDRNA